MSIATAKDLMDEWEKCVELDVEYEEYDDILAYFLYHNIIFLNTHWFKEDWPAEAQKTIILYVNCNDVFAWGCADAEEIKLNQLKELWKYYKKDRNYGAIVWCIKQANILPQKPMYDLIQKESKFNLDEMNLKPNLTWINK